MSDETDVNTFATGSEFHPDDVYQLHVDTNGDSEPDITFSNAVRYDHTLRTDLTSLRFLDGPHGALLLGAVEAG